MMRGLWSISMTAHMESFSKKTVISVKQQSYAKMVTIIAFIVIMTSVVNVLPGKGRQVMEKMSHQVNILKSNLQIPNKLLKIRLFRLIRMKLIYRQNLIRTIRLFKPKYLKWNVNKFRNKLNKIATKIKIKARKTYQPSLMILLRKNREIKKPHN